MGGAGNGAGVMPTAPARLEFSHDGAVATITLAAPKANIIDRGMIAAIGDHLDTIATGSELVAVVIAADGPHFSFGASVEEHLPDRIGGTLGALHALLRRLIDLPAPTIAAIRGLCLGGGFELALACDLIVAEAGAQFGCPEIKLGVFPPAASVLLPPRIGSARAAALTLTGAPIDTTQAELYGLVAVVAAAGQLEPMLGDWLRKTFVPRPAVALKYAALAVRQDVKRAMDAGLSTAERLYLEGLMIHPDPVEGIRAFMDKREPRWSRAATERVTR
jgi:cyclohexa-1,5-dienecarbonyl-CoA hydratase